MVTAIRSYFSNYFNFSGRASRREYWYVQLFHFIVILLFSTLGYLFFLLWLLWVLFNLLPSLSLYVRRLHDIDRSAWFLLCSFIPYVGWIILFIFTLVPGTEGANRYGHSKYSKMNFRNPSKFEEQVHSNRRRNTYRNQRRNEEEEEDEWDDF